MVKEAPSVTPSIYDFECYVRLEYYGTPAATFASPAQSDPNCDRALTVISQMPATVAQAVAEQSYQSRLNISKGIIKDGLSFLSSPALNKLSNIASSVMALV